MPPACIISSFSFTCQNFWRMFVVYLSYFFKNKSSLHFNFTTSTYKPCQVYIWIIDGIMIQVLTKALRLNRRLLIIHIVHSFFLSFFPYIYLPIYLSITLYISIYISVYLSIYLSIYPYNISIYLSIYLSNISVYLSL